MDVLIVLRKKQSFPLGIFSVNVSKSGGNYPRKATHAHETQSKKIKDKRRLTVNVKQS